jgi:hypothetical protein
MGSCWPICLFECGLCRSSLALLVSGYNKAIPGKSLSKVLQRIFWDEFVFTPSYLPVFFSAWWTLEGSKPQRVKNILYHELGTIIVAEWVVWVPTMFLSFRFGPVKFQVLVINLVGVAWQTFFESRVYARSNQTS